MIKDFFSRSKDETREFARQCASGFQRGDVIALVGGLGAGKTEFARGICDVFNVRSTVTSPTFTIVNSYEGTTHNKPILIHHFDLFRLEHESELQNIGFDELIYGDGISIIEWADKFPVSVPKHAKKIVIESVGETERRIVVGK